MVFVGHGHFSRAVVTRWVEQPVYEGIRFAMAAASIAVCGFEHGVRQLNALGLTGPPQPVRSRRDARTDLRARRTAPAPWSPKACTPPTPGSPTRVPRWRRTAHQSFWAPYLLTSSKPAALIRPQAVQFTDALPDWPLRAAAHGADHADAAGPRGAPRPHRRGAAQAAGSRQRPAQGGAGPGVAAGQPTDRWTPAPSCDRLAADDAAANAYLADLTAAGGGYAGAALVGASPELLVARRGEQVTCRPFAGSAPRLADPDADRGQRRRARRVGQEPPRAPTGRRRDARGAGPVVRRPSDRAGAAAAARPRRCGTCTPPSPAGCAKNQPPHWISRSRCIPTPAVGGVPATRGRGTDRRAGGRPRLLRRRGRLVRPARRRPLGGVDPLRAAVGRSPHRRRALGRRHRRRIRSRRRSRRKPQRNSAPSCRPWECSHDRDHPPRPSPATRPN